MSYLQKYNEWKSKATDIVVLKQLQEMADNQSAIENAFYKDLEFGTAGLRGEMGAGTNCLNIYTVKKTTAGVADCMLKHNQSKVAITFDSRLNSQLFAETVAQVFAQKGIKCYLTENCQPTPYLSYLVRNLKCDIGINITASHNPMKYNGYKVYGSDGCQLTDEYANEMTKYIDAVDPFLVNVEPLENYIKSGLVQYTSTQLETDYLETVLKHNLNCADGIKIAYTPLNGVGYKMVPKILKSVGVKTIDIVEEQGVPDGHFRTCSYPNPEKPQAMALAIELGKQKNSDLVIGTDPDCDRIGVAVRVGDDFKLLTGNEVGVLLTQYILESLSLRKGIKPNSIVVKTIVTSALTDKVANQFGVKVCDVLTGFKYIGSVIGQLEKQNQEEKFIFGFEESCGYLRGSYVRDKDAVIASMLVAEMVATYKKQGLTLLDVLQKLYEKFGTYQHLTLSYSFDGASGADKKQRLLNQLRTNPIEQIGGKKVVEVVDYLTQTTLDLPKADVIKFIAEDGTILIIRPSGTEPLIKTYITVSSTPQQNKLALQNITNQMDEMFKS